MDGETTEVEEPPADAPEPPQIDLVEALKKATRYDWFIVGGLVVATLFSLLSWPIAAFLLAHVKTHLIATASVSADLTAGAAVFAGKDSLPLVLVLGVVGLIKFDPFFYLAGRRWGHGVTEFFEQQGTFKKSTIDRAERWVARFGPAMVPVATLLPVVSVRLVLVLLGVSGVSWIRFLVADVIGAALFCGLYVALGHHFHSQVDHVAHVVNHYSLLVFIGLLVVIVGLTAMRTGRQAKRT